MKNHKDLLIFDLDNTIIKCDSFKIFLFTWLKNNPKILYYNIIYLCLIYFMFLIRIINREDLKLRFLKIIFKNVNKKKIKIFCDSFSDFIIKKYLRYNAKLFLKKKKNFFKILITASPDFYVKKIAEELSFNKVFCTKFIIKKNNVRIVGKNCYGSQKLKIIKKQKYDKNNLIFFTDSSSDLPLISFCKKSFVIPNTIIDHFLLRNYPKLNWKI